MGKRKSNKMEASSVKNNDYTTVDGCCVAESHFLSDTISEGNQCFGSTQSMSNLAVDDFDTHFQVPVDTALLFW